MRLASVRHLNSVHLALVWNHLVLSAHAAASKLLSENAANLLPASVGELLVAGPEPLAVLRRMAEVLDNVSAADLGEGIILGNVDRVKFLPPVTRPGKLICLAGNYAEHINEGGKERAPEKETTNPWLFSKPVGTGLIGHGEAVLIPRVTHTIDWEVELAIVIGRRGKYISAERADDHIFGYTVFNDISARTLNLAPQRTQRPKDPFYDWLHGKQLDTHACMGPWIVDRDSLGDPQNLSIRLAVNGVVKQDSNTRKMIFFIPEIVEFASQIMTLEPGDIIATGTPAGIGHVRGEYLRPGDRIEASIEGIGTLYNPVSAETQEAS